MDSAVFIVLVDWRRKQWASFRHDVTNSPCAVGSHPSGRFAQGFVGIKHLQASIHTRKPSKDEGVPTQILGMQWDPVTELVHY